MKITILMEDTCGNPKCKYEHGLSIYVETPNHKLLLDTGATGAFIENAEKLGIDLTQVDTVVLSHGHYDHSGGIMKFAELNPHADIYMQVTATGEYYHGERYIGIDKRIAELPQIHFVEDDYRIDEELYLYSDITGRRFWPQSNLKLSKLRDDKAVQDDFAHEQCLVVTAEGKKILLSGCAHNGILNILDKYESIYRTMPDIGKYHAMPDIVISGFHMMKKEEYNDEEIAMIEDTARELAKFDTVFYTGHCTGQKAFDIMHDIMGEQLIQIHSGMELQKRDDIRTSEKKYI